MVIASFPSVKTRNVAPPFFGGTNAPSVVPRRNGHTGPRVDIVQEASLCIEAKVRASVDVYAVDHGKVA